MGMWSRLVVWLLLCLTLVLMSVALWMVFYPGADGIPFVPDEKTMGAVYRIFFFHVPSAIVSFAAVFVLLASSVAYLWTRDTRWDNLSLAATETALVFGTIVLITGPIWAKPAWGAWWTWEPRLTTMLILWILLAAALMVRGYAENRDLGARIASVLGIVAAVDVPIIHVSIKWIPEDERFHPNMFNETGKEASMEPEMLKAFLLCLLVFFLLCGLMMTLRFFQAQMNDRVERLSQRLARG